MVIRFDELLTMTKDPSRTLKTLERGMTLIDTIKDGEGVTLEDLVSVTGFAKSTVHGYVTTFEELGYVVKEDGKYHLGLRFLNLASYARSRKPEYELAKAVVERLGEQTDAEVDFDIEENGRIINLFNVLGSTNHRSVEVNLYFYMHTTATGKAILASWSDNRVRSVIEQWGLPEVTAHTITSEEALFEQLEAIQHRGYAVNNQQHLDGIHSIGAAVMYPDNSVFGGISIAGPHYRMDKTRIENYLAPELLEAVDIIETRLGDEFDEGLPEADELYGDVLQDHKAHGMSDSLD